jgi:membrane protein
MPQERKPPALPQSIQTLFQRIWITIQYFGSNGLANHAAAGAYGFLLSLMPALLIVAFVLSRIYGSAHEAASLILRMGILGNAFDIGGTVEKFLDTLHPGITGLVSLVSMLWAAIVFAFSLQRGLNSIFISASGGTANPLKANLIPLGLELTVILFVFITVMGSAFLGGASGTLKAVYRILPFAGLGLLTLGVYRMVPNNPPGFKPSLAGAVFCTVVFAILSALFSVFINPARYGLIYGTLGDLIVLLARVYFFFMFFFIGAQFAFVFEYFDALLFIKLRMVRSAAKPFFVEKFLFISAPTGRLAKYLHSYTAGETIFLQGEDSHDIYYILSGSAEIYLDNKKSGSQDKVAEITADTFFGEMGHVLVNKRSATAKAASGLSALVLPSRLFKQILTIDQNADSKVIETLSERLRNTNDQLSQ